MLNCEISPYGVKNAILTYSFDCCYLTILFEIILQIQMMLFSVGVHSTVSSIAAQWFTQL